MKRKGQEEIVGFVIVMVLVSIVILILLGLSLSNEPGSVNSKDIEQFLQSSLEYTSTCAIRYVPDYARIGELVDSCRQHETCTDGRNACDVLNSTFSEIIPVGLHIGPESPFIGYMLNITYSVNKSQEIPQTTLYLGLGNCTGASRRGASIVLPGESEGLNYVALEACSKA